MLHVLIKGTTTTINPRIYIACLAFYNVNVTCHVLWGTNFYQEELATLFFELKTKGVRNHELETLKFKSCGMRKIHIPQPRSMSVLSTPTPAITTNHRSQL